MFKLRYSYGKVGNDNVGTRFPYVEKFGTWDEDGYYYGDIGKMCIRDRFCATALSMLS